MSSDPTEGRRRRKSTWRDYRTAGGGRPVLDEFRKLSDAEYADVRVEMDEVAKEGLVEARHLRGDVYEVRTDTGSGLAVRVLFAEEGKYRKVLLSLRVFKKKTTKTPKNEIDVAEDRLRDWRSRAGPSRAEAPKRSVSPRPSVTKRA
ncbi:MAG: type II toxin-antitoxin system RelE/ParE family toxin [Chloroflexota bacterium]